MPDASPADLHDDLQPCKKLKCDIIRARSPLRVSFTGGGTDVPLWYEQHPGAVLSSTINRYAYVSLYPREDRQIRIRSLDLGYSVDYDLDQGPAYDGVMDLAKVSIRRLGVKRGLDIDIRSDAPAGSGLGGSSALTSAVLAALAEFRGVKISREKLAELNYTVERIDLEITGGKQDQYATAYGGFNCIKFSKDLVAVEPVEVDPSVVIDLEAHLLMCYTGKVRAKANLVDRQLEMFKQGRASTLDGMKRLY
ncbi:MAG: GHMP kinase, partial [Planctomycetota bacterium]